ncbi:MAG: BTAD domain-containing putative transcriptional regulator [Chloroflexota bacterium]
MDHLSLSFFGVFQAALGSKPLEKFRSAKVQGLLIYLSLTPRQTHARDVLAALFWPNEPEAAAKLNLRQSLFRLRTVLGDGDADKESIRQAQGQPYLLITRATVQFNPVSHYSLDVADFLAALAEGALATAVSHYQGDLLPGFSCDSLPFEEWLRQTREQYHRQALDALSQLTANSLSQADFQAARQFSKQQLVLEPWREEAHRQLMQALASLGERTAALTQYESCRTILAEELGVEPSPETINLVKRIREAHLAQPAQQTAVTTTRQRLKIPFVGRQAEYETLIKAYQRALHHGLQLVTVQGQSGIGKTRLTEQFVTWAATQGADVLVGRSFATSTGLSYQPITHLLRQRLERENAPEDLLSDFWLSQVTRLLPELRERYPDLPEPTQEENTAREHLFEAITRLMQALAARKPLLLFIDDWHWADTASLDLLYYAVVHCSEEKLPILILLTLRQEAISESPELQIWLTKLHHATDTLSLPLKELSQRDTEQLIQTLLEPEIDHRDTPLTQFCEWLFAETNGQPLFLTETLKALVEDGLVQPNVAGTGQAVWHIDGSKFDERGANSYFGRLSAGRVLHGVQEIIQGWLARLTPQAKDLLTAVSVLAQHATFERLCHVAGLGEMQAIEALDDLLGKQLLHEADSALILSHHDPVYSFSHQKVSDVVYAEAGAARRRLLHRRAFETLRSSATPLVSPPAADLAHHALHAGLLAETIHHSLIAGNEAMAIFAVRVAIPHFETAWQLAEQKGWPEEVSGADRQSLYSALGRAYELTEDWLKAQAIYEAMLAYAQTLGATAIECLGLNHLATVYLTGLADRPQALQILEQAHRVAEQSSDRRGLAETEWNLSSAAIQVQNAKLALHHSERALAIAHELGHPHLLARCLTSTAQAYAFLRQWDKALPYVLETNRMYIADGDLVMAANSQRGIGFLQIFSGHPAESLNTLQESFAFSQRIENLTGEADCAWILARAHLEAGNYGEAIKLGRQAVEQTHTLSHPLLHSLARSAWGIIQRTVMDWEAAGKTLLAIFEQSPAEGVIGWTDQTPELCALYAAVGDWEQAYMYARQVTHPMHDDEPLLPFNLTGWYETEALLRGGDGALARTGIARLGKAVGDNKRYRLILLRSQAVLAQWDGDIAQAIWQLENALALAEEIGLPGEAWPISAELGRLYAEQGEMAQAREAYQEAANVIHRLAETIDEDGLRMGFLTAVPVRSVLERNEKIESL